MKNKQYRFKKRFMSLCLTTGIVASMFNGVSFNVNAKGNGEGNDSDSIYYENADQDPKLTFPDGTPVNTESDDFDPDFDYSSYALDAGFEIANDEVIKDEAAITTKKRSLKKFSMKENFPASVDLSKEKYFPPVGDQHSIGACVGFADVYYEFTYEYCRANDLAAKDGNIMSTAFVYNQLKHYYKDTVKNKESQGGINDIPANEILKREGTPFVKDADFENYGREEDNSTYFPDKEIWKKASHHRANGYKFLEVKGPVTGPKDSDLDEVKSYLNQGHVLTFTSLVTYNDDGIIPEGSAHAGEWIRLETYEGEKAGCHKMTIVGYDDDVYFDINGNGTIEDSERGAFKIANSWGKSWGNNGFFWYSYDSLNAESACGKVSATGNKKSRAFGDIFYQEVLPGDHSSDIFLVADLESANRTENRVTIYAVNKKTGKEFKEDVAAFSVCNELPAAIAGKTSNRGSIAYDLNNVVKDITVDTIDDYEWSVKVKDNGIDNSNITRVYDLYIESDGKIYKSYNEGEKELNAVEETFALSVPYEKNIVWDLGDNAALPKEERRITASCKLEGKELYDASYRFTLIKDKSETLIRDYSSDNSCNWTPENGGEYKVRVDVKYGDEIISFSKIFYVKEINVKSFKYNANKCKVNKKVEFNLKITDSIKELNVVDIIIKSEQNEVAKIQKKYGRFEWRPEKSGDYKVYADVNCDGENVTIEVGNIHIGEEEALEIKEFKNESDEEVGISDYLQLKCYASGGSGEFRYTFGVIYNGKEYYGKFSTNITNPYTYTYMNELYNPSENDPAYNYGKNTFFVDVKDEITGKTVRATIDNVDVVGLSVRDFHAYSSHNEIYVGEKMNLLASARNAAGSAEYSFYYSEDNGETFKQINENVNGAYAEFVCDKIANYKFKVVVTDKAGKTAEKIIDVNVVAKKEIAVIYYNNPNFAKAYIHYSVNGQWTEAPGVQMKASNRDGYKWMYEIPVDAELAKNADIKVCFNDGNNNWDSSNGKNYSVSIASIGIKDGKVNKLDKKVVVYYDNRSWKNANIHYAVDGKTWTVAPGVAMKKSDRPEYRFMYEIDVKEADGVSVCFNNGNGQWDSRNGENYYLTDGKYLVVNGNIVFLED